VVLAGAAVGAAATAALAFGLALSGDEARGSVGVHRPDSMHDGKAGKPAAPVGIFPMTAGSGRSDTCVVIEPAGANE